DDLVTGVQTCALPICRQVFLAEGPFLAHQASYSVPVAALQRFAQFLSNGGDTLQVVLHFLLAVDLGLKHLPVVDARAPRFSRIEIGRASCREEGDEWR